MFKRIVSFVVVVAIALGLPMLAIGCNQDEVKTQQHTEIKDQVIDQHTVVK